MTTYKTSELKEYTVLKGFNINFSNYFIFNDITISEIDPLLHYIKYWREENLIIPHEFNTFEYLYLYQDVLLSGQNPLLHYLSQGIHEHREPYLQERSMSDDEVEKIKCALKNDGTNTQDREHFLTEEQLRLITALYQSEVNWDKVRSKFKLAYEVSDNLEFIIELSKKNSKTLLNLDAISSDSVIRALDNNLITSDLANIDVTRYSQNQEDQHLVEEYREIIKLNLDWSGFFVRNNVHPNLENDPIEYYIENWNKVNLYHGDDFDTEFYLDLYPDVKESNINPLLHFFKHGKNEGRSGYLDFNQHINLGEIEFEPRKKTIVIVSHESSATGAPLVGLSIGKLLCESHNVVHIVMHTSVLHESYRSNCSVLVENLRGKEHSIVKKVVEKLANNYTIDAMICNSVETFPVLQAASELHIPTVSLVHEFSEYTRPRGKIASTVVHADQVVVPATLLKESMLRDIKESFGVKVIPNNIQVSPQGKLPYMPEENGISLTPEELKRKFDIEPETKVIIGAGYVQMRKGVDIFISTASKIKQKYNGKCKFIWVGAGYDPDSDLQYSAWLKAQIDAAGLNDDLFFLEHQSNLDNVLSITDCFMLTSRLDPFPNVVIDALEANVHVACFENSTGCAEFLLHHNANCSIAPYLDSEELARIITQNFHSTTKVLHKGRNINKKIVQENLCFNKYINSILEYIEYAKESVEKRKQIELTLTESNQFDACYASTHGESELEVGFYVKAALKGIHFTNPKPGFSELKWLSANSNPYQVPLYQAIVQNEDVFTHSCHIISGSVKTSPNIKIAVHLHLYYVELADEFAHYFSHLPDGYDLYITTCDTNSDEYITNAFIDCGANNFTIKHVDNIGRDIAPMLLELKRELTETGYDVVGHFHSKKSLETDEHLGDRWRTYLLDNLIGSREAANEILGLFSNENIGLVFAEDRHLVDFGKNKPFSDELCREMGIKSLDQQYVFPLGTMFWASPTALAPLFNLNLKKYLQDEPLPYDGSHMHAIERLIPYVCNTAQKEFLTVYSDGTTW